MTKALVFISVFLGIVLIGLPLVIRDVYVMQILITVFFYAFVGSAWNIVGGYAGALSLGHSVYVGIGAYASGILFVQFGVTPWIGMFVGGLVATALSVVIGFPSLRLRGPYFALGSIAFAAIIQLWFLDTDQFLGLNIRAARGIMLPVLGDAPTQFQFVEKWPYYYIILGFTGVLVLLVYWMHRTKLGFYLAAIRSNPPAAEAIGINVARMKMIAFAASAFFSAIGGAFYAQWILFFNPERLFGADLSFELVFIGIVGGRASVLGPVLGALVLVPIGEFTRVYLGGGKLVGIHLVVYGLALMLAIVYIPQGLNGLIVSLRERFRKPSPMKTDS
jgi:branched-chain amino acid transport system permease protein